MKNGMNGKHTGPVEEAPPVIDLDPEEVASQRAKSIDLAIRPLHRQLARAWLFERGLLDEVEPETEAEADDGPRRNGSFTELASQGNPRPAAVPRNPDEWEPPQLDGLPPAPAFPAGSLPAPIRDFVLSAADAIVCPADYVGVHCLSVAGAAMGRSVAIEIKPRQWHELGALWTVVVGPPGGAKTAAFKAACGPTWMIEARLRHEHRAAEAERQIRQAMAAEMRASGAAKKARELGADEVAPQALRFAMKNLTVEAVSKRLAANPRGMIVTNDELSGWITGMNQYKSGGKGSDIQFFLDIWSSTPLIVDRAGQDDGAGLSVPEPFLGITGCLTPEVLSGLGIGDRDDGFIDRLLCAYPEPIPRQWSDDEVPEALGGRWNSAVNRLFAREMGAGEWDLDRPHMIPFAPDARELYKAWYNANCEEGRSPLLPRSLVGPWFKFQTYAARLALILELLDWACSRARVDAPRAVGPAAVTRALDLVAYFQGHARRVHSLLKGSNVDNDLGRVILAWIQKGKLTSFKENQPRKNLERRLLGGEDPNALEKALEWLVNRRVIRKGATSVQSRGNRPSITYEVNPDLGGAPPRPPQATYPFPREQVTAKKGAP